MLIPYVARVIVANSLQVKAIAHAHVKTDRIRRIKNGQQAWRGLCRTTSWSCAIGRSMSQSDIIWILTTPFGEMSTIPSGAVVPSPLWSVGTIDGERWKRGECAGDERHVEHQQHEIAIG